MVAETDITDQPFPIRRHFRRLVVPAMVASGFLALVWGWVSINALDRKVYLENARRQMETAVSVVEHTEPDLWSSLLSGESPAQILADPARLRAKEMLTALANDGHLLHLKLFNERGVVLFSNDLADLGVREDSAILRQVQASGEAAIERTQRDGQDLYEIYVPLRSGGRSLVFELYQPTTELDELIMRSFVGFAVLPGFLMVGFGIWLGRIVRRAQIDIDSRVAAQQTLRKQLERFVSHRAGAAARQSPEGQVPTTRVGMSLFYSDVRDFTSLAELNPPKATVSFLNELMTRQVEVVTRHDGDVDKMIGDALLVRFEGADREARALLAAQEILADLAKHPMARGIGIGIYDGEAILGAIGPAERQDFTVIGDSVNLAARLCALAGDGQLVVDELALRRSGLPDSGFGAVEEQQVKGRAAQVRVRRWSPSQDVKR
ncbi:MAG: adenylate/guanylate cyclase domain-containing protein [Magnetospirillum sp.]|nr:adenylate/guanylate cyclase domain-containing protein [Magnetospirillum sp.]